MTRLVRSLTLPQRPHRRCGAALSTSRHAPWALVLTRAAVLAANASAGPSFDSMWFQDVQSNLTCAVAKPSTSTAGRAGTGTMRSPMVELNCTCFGRHGDVESGCYDVSSQPDLQHVLGGEAALWSEAVDRDNFEQAVMMAAGVAAERLWSPRTTLDVQDARHRLGALRTKLLSRGYKAAPLPP